MSILLMTQVWELELPHPQQSVLLAMADHARDDGTRCYPSRARLSYKTNYSIRQVKRIMAELRIAGLIVVVKESTRYEPTHYRIVIEAGTRKPGFDKWWAEHPENRRRAKGGQDVPPDLDDHEGQVVPPGDDGRGDTNDRSGGTPPPPRGDMAVSPKPSLNHQKNQTPQPPKGGATKRPSPPSGKRRRDIVAHEKELQEWAPHPSDADPALADAWKRISTVVADQIDTATFDLWVAPCHLHRAVDGSLTVAHPRAIGGWVTRFAPALQAAAGEPIEFVACDRAA